MCYNQGMVYRIAATADQHLGYSSGLKTDERHVNLRRADGHRALDAITRDIIAHKDVIDSVLIPGDIFHTSHPENLDIIMAQHYLREMAKVGLRIDVLDGNHDTTKKAGEPSAVALLNDPDRGIHAHYTPYKIEQLADDVFLHIVPHGGLSLDEAPELFPVKGAFNIYTTHGAAVDPGNKELMRCHHSPNEQVIPPEVILDPDFQLRILGHYHQRAFVGSEELNTWYTGSTLRRRFSDGKGARGWTLFTIHDDGRVEVEHHDIFQRPQYDLDVINGLDRTPSDIQDEILENLSLTREDEIGAPFDNIRAPIIRQRVINIPHSIRKALDNKLISSHVAHASEWVPEFFSPVEMQRMDTPVSVEGEGEESTTHTHPTLTPRGRTMNVVEAYKDWAFQSRVLNELEEVKREKVKGIAEEHLKKVQDTEIVITDV